MSKFTAKNLKGFSLLEVLVALVLFSVIILSVNASQTQYIKSNHSGQIKAEAVYAAQTVIDEIRQKNILTLPTTGSDSARQIQMNSKRSYDVVVNYCSNSSYCSTADVRHISLSVSYKGENIYQTETVFTDFGKAPSATPTPSVAPSPSRSPSPSPSPSPSRSPSPSPSPSRSPSPSPSPSRSPSPSPSRSPSPSPSPSRSPSPSPSRRCVGWWC